MPANLVPHALALGAHVELWRDGVHQQDAVVFRHDRNGTYRLLHEATSTYVTAYPNELKLPGELAVAYEVSREDGTVFFVEKEKHARDLASQFDGWEYRPVNWASRKAVAP
jgi:hypothetical protein